jgi:Pyruvate/2-oxoacid:ferredoxin oxidoreductase gamma subunit
VLVFNNFNFGMTGGQHSTTTPSGAVTSTTPGGNLERPLDICATVAVNGAGYVWRGTSFDKDLSGRIGEAVQADCFALLDIWELCTAYFVPNNQASKRTLTTILDELGFRAGLLHRESYPEYAMAYRKSAGSRRGMPLVAPRPIAPRFASPLSRTFRLVVAGSAGGKVKSAARLVGEAALLSGLWAAQRDDYPITVMAGHSIAEIVLSPREIDYTAITRPDAMILLSREGVAKVGPQLAAMTPEDRVFAVPEVADVKTSAAVRVIDPAKIPARLGKGSVALYCIARALKELRVFPIEALGAAVMLQPSQYAEKNAEAIRAAVGQG